MKVTVLFGSSGRFQEWPQGRWGGRIRQDVWGRQDPQYPEAILGRFSLGNLATAVASAMRNQDPPAGLGGGHLIEVEVPDESEGPLRVV